MKGISFHSGRFREVARMAIERSSTDRREAWTAIVFSAMALEAMVNEMALIADFCSRHIGADRIATASKLLKEAEEQHATAWLKTQIVVSTLTGKSLDSSDSVFADFMLLFSIRNALVHLKGEYVDYTKPDSELLKTSKKIVRSLVGRGVLDSAAVKHGDTWLDTVADARVARWAHVVPERFATRLLSELPQDNFHLHLANGWRDISTIPPLDDGRNVLATGILSFQVTLGGDPPDPS